jgi:hypothetical protein
MSPTNTYLEFRAQDGLPFLARLYAIGGIPDAVVAEAGLITSQVDGDDNATGRWQASFFGLAPGDYNLIVWSDDLVAFEGSNVVADERYTIPASGAVAALQPWSEQKPLSLSLPVNANIVQVLGVPVTPTSLPVDANVVDIEQDQLDAIAAAMSSPGSGMHLVTFTIKRTNGSTISGCDVNITTSSAGPNSSYIATSRTDANGVVQFYLDAGTYWGWKQKDGVQFSNPFNFTVDEEGEVEIL